MFTLSIGVSLLPTTEVGEFSIQIRDDVLESRHTATTVPCSLTGCLLLGKLSQNGTVRLKLGDSNLRSCFDRRGVRCEQGEEEANAIPDLNAQGLIDANQLTWGGIGVDDGQINALPWMAGKCAPTLIGDVFKATFSKVGAWVNMAALHHGFNNGDPHRFSQGPQFCRVF